MSLSFEEIQAILKELQEQLKDQKLVAAYDVEPRKFLLDFGNQRVFLSFQEPYLRFHFSKLKSSKIQTPLVKGLNNFLKNAVLKSLEIVNQDRVLEWKFFTSSGSTFTLFMDFIPRKPNCVLTNYEKTILLSLNALEQKTYQPHKARIKPVREGSSVTDSQAIERRYTKIEAQDAFVKKKNQIRSAIESQVKSFFKRLKRAEAHYLECLKWEETHHEALLLQANFHLLKKGLESVSIEDWEKPEEVRLLRLNPLKSPSDNISEYFKKSKKLKKGLEYALKEVQISQEKLEAARTKLTQLEAVNSLKELDPFVGTQKTKRKQDNKPLPYREYISETGTKIWVGKNAHDNDKLTFSYSKGSDWWLHVSGVPGSHVLIKVPKDQEPDRETLLDAIQCAIFYSKAKEQKTVEICVTQKKFVSRFGKGQPGKVQISQHRLVHAITDPERFKRLKTFESRSL